MTLSPRQKTALMVVFALVLLAVTVLALRNEFGGGALDRALTALAAIPSPRIVIACVLTLGSYLLLTVYDILALRYVKQPLSLGTTLLTSFIAYAFSNNIGFGPLIGGAVRARCYGKHGLGASDIARVATFAGITTWLGAFAVGGVALLIVPPHEGVAMGLRVLGAVAVSLVVAYLAACGVMAAGSEPRHLTLWRFSLPVPNLRQALQQVGLSTADWLLAGAVLLLLTPRLPTDTVLGALVAFRALYYLGPFILALVAFGFSEAADTTTGKLVVRALRGIVPEVSAVLVFLGGVVLLVSGALPSIDARMRALHHLVPLALIESSHLVGSAVGIGLIILARGLWRRLDSAWALAIALASAGAVASVLKGFDWEEASVLTMVVIVLVPHRDKFYRKGSLLSEPLSGSFLLGVAAIVAGTLYLGWLSYEHVNYRHELFWKMALNGNAPRFLRAAISIVAVLIVYGASQLVRPTKLRKKEASDEDIARALAIADQNAESQARLVAMGDKQVLFSDDGKAFIMYGVEGRSFIAMGDPIGDPAASAGLIKKFRVLADSHDAGCAFYQVLPESITNYVDRGFALVKLGEEARVDLTEFGLEGRAMRSLRGSYKKAAKEVVFSVVDTADVPAILPQLKRISDAWLGDKNTREKGFSLGGFDEDYLKTGPVAVAKKGDDIVAFANLWTTSTKEELSIDLMRFDDRAPNGTMDYLFAELMLWGKAQGYRWFSLGMAPMSGLDDGPLSPLWSRAFGLIFRHGEALYNFKGLRAYKEKFDPVWRGRYLASAKAVDVPRILASVATLTSRGLSGVFAR